MTYSGLISNAREELINKRDRMMMIPCYVYCALVHNDVDQDKTCLTKFDVKYLCFFSYFVQKNINRGVAAREYISY